MTRWIAIAAAFVNLGVHTALTPMHLEEVRYVGVLFILGSTLLGAVIVGLSSDRDSLRTLAWLGGAAVCAVEIVLFVISRTGGLPGGYREAWVGQTEDWLGLASLVVEAVFIACAAHGLTRATARHAARHSVVSWIPVRDRSAQLR